MKYARGVGAITAALRVEDRGPAAFLAETLPSVAGQIVFPPGYLAEAYRHVREAGGVCIADEVQTGFGRLGSHRWGFEAQGVVPDIVVLGKPIGNAFPLAAVVTTREIATSFDNGDGVLRHVRRQPGGVRRGPGRVLDVLKDEGLQDRAWRVGTTSDRRAASAPGATPADRRRAGLGALPGSGARPGPHDARACSRGGRLRRRAPPGAWGPDGHGRAPRERPEAAAAPSSSPRRTPISSSKPWTTCSARTGLSPVILRSTEASLRASTERFFGLGLGYGLPKDISVMLRS